MNIPFKINNILTVEKFYELYLTEKKAIGVGKKSLGNYTNIYKLFTNPKYFGFDKNRPVREINKKVYEDFIIYLRERGTLSPTSIYTYAKELRTMINFGFREGYIVRFEMIKIPEVSVVKPIYTMEEQNVLTEKPVITAKTRFTTYRDWVIASVLLGTGFRSQSMREIVNEDVDLENSLIRIDHEKNKNQRVFPLSKETKNVLSEYMTIRGGNSSDFLFCTKDGLQLSEGGFKSLIKRYNRKNGIKKTSPHLMRHTFSTMYLINGGDEGRLQKLLDHKTRKMTQHYAENYTGVHMRSGYDDCNPLDNLREKKRKGEYIKMPNLKTKRK